MTSEAEPTRSRNKSIRFAGFILDAAESRLVRGEQILPLRRRTLAVLHYLALRPGRLVTKTELFAAIWPGVTVSEIVLAVCISELRKALDDSAKIPRLIETVHGRGYRFIGTIDDERVPEVGVLVVVGFERREQVGRAGGLLEFAESLGGEELHAIVRVLQARRERGSIARHPVIAEHLQGLGTHFTVGIAEQGAHRGKRLLVSGRELTEAPDRVAPKIVATVEELEAIAESDNADVPSLHGWRRALFGEKALADRIAASGSRLVFTADATYRKGKDVALKPIVDEAVRQAGGVVERVVSLNRTGAPVPMQDGRDLTWDDFMARGSGQSGDCVPMESN